MSMENMLKMVDMTKDDGRIARRVKEIGFQNAEGLIAYSRELGLAIDEHDLEELKEMAAKKSDELGENELNMISGGWFFNNESTYVGYNAY